MPFSNLQQRRHYRPTIARAAAKAGVEVRDKAALDAFVRGNLHEWLGVYSTKELNAGPDFTFVMMKYEQLLGDGYRWRLQYENQHVNGQVHKIREICRELDLEEDYARGVARQALGLGRLPLFPELSPRQLQTVLRVLKAQGSRIAAAANAGGRPF
jgi:hypothetical protein